MKKQNLKINILRFTPVNPIVEFTFFKEKKENTYPIHINDCPVKLANNYTSQERNANTYIYTNFSKEGDGDFSLEIDLTRTTRFAKHYFNHIITQYFQAHSAQVFFNFINDITIWLETPEQTNVNYTTYQEIVIRVQSEGITEITEGYELVIYDNGLTRLLKRSIGELEEINLDTFSNVVYKNKYLHISELSEEARANYHEVYPIVNKSIQSYFGYSPITNKYGNKYLRTWETLNQFLLQYIQTAEFQNIIALKETEFIEIPEKRVLKTKSQSALIRLGLGDNKQDVYSPKENLSKYGPYSLPKNTQVKFIMIFHENDKNLANKFVQIMKKRYQKPDGTFMEDMYSKSLYDFIRVRFELDIENSIKFTDELNPFDAIHNFLDTHTIDRETYNYIALYLSPFSINETDVDKKEVYYKVKKTLIEHDITSQAIFRDHITKPVFKKYYFVNIASAILAKIGGVPWKLVADNQDELVVGIGAFKSKKFNVKYIGSAFCFSNTGDFKEFNCRSTADSFLLAQEIKLMIQDFVKKNEKLDRIIIHFYKQMSYEEIEPIKKVLFQLGYDHIPIIIININKTFSKDYLVFDSEFKELLPYSGTIINYSKNKYLLFNNTRYMEEQTEIESYHSPLKLTFQSTKPEAIEDVAVVKELIDQVYQFSRLYWKSVKQQNLPVTVKYPEMVAKIYPHFDMDDLNEFGRTNLWFL
jgi:hypothetical protein